jgi:hypothetical protein
MFGGENCYEIKNDNEKMVLGIAVFSCIGFLMRKGRGKRLGNSRGEYAKKEVANAVTAQILRRLFV